MRAKANRTGAFKITERIGENMNFLKRAWAEIDIPALLHNVRVIEALCPDADLMAVIKADAYGHGVEHIVPALTSAGLKNFAVSNLEEALQLRDLGVSGQILILGYTPPQLARFLSENDITQAVYSLDFARALSDFAEKDNCRVKIHLKIDTGMGRIGFDCRSDALPGFDEAIQALHCPGLLFDGVFTHFAAADRAGDPDASFTEAQYRRFCAAIRAIEQAGFSPRVRHCCNSAGLLLHPDKHLDLCRPGIILYGLSPDRDLPLQADFIPVMTFKSVVSLVKEINTGESVSYGRTFTADKPMRIATVSVGYADGYPRILSNRGEVLIGGRRAKIVGKVCMDQLCVDVSDIQNVKIGDEVVLFGKDLSVDELAELAGTINYEIVCGLSKRVPRIIKR